MPRSHQPQTLKQAKRAFQRAGPARPSASDIAQAERRAELQERADRIREREARRKANFKKRDEKIAREREAAKSTGKPLFEDQKPRWRVGASQLSLGGFLNGIKKLGEPDHKKLALKKDFEGDTGNSVPRKQAEPDSGDTLPSPPLEAPARSSVDKPACTLSGTESPFCSSHRMPPPPIPRLPKQLEMLDETFEDCFPSNTQIQRELSPGPCKATTAFHAANTYSLYGFGVEKDTEQHAVDANDLLACISTQDLNVSSTPNPPFIKHEELDLLAQISTQDLDFRDFSPKPVTKAKSVDPELLLAEISTQDLNFSQESIEIKTEIKSANTESFTDFDFDLEKFIMECGMDGSESVHVNPSPVC